MKNLKMNLENIQGKLSRNEMRKIMAGSGGGSNRCNYFCNSDSECDSTCPSCKSMNNWPGKVCDH
jgi:predicted Zn-ribbon and HTH transcriptional regulator